MEPEGFEPSSKPRKKLLSTRLDLINCRCKTGSNQTLSFTYSLDTNSRLTKSHESTLHGRRPNFPSGRVWPGWNDGIWLVYQTKQPWHTKYCQLSFEGFIHRKYLQLPTCLQPIYLSCQNRSVPKQMQRYKNYKGNSLLDLISSITNKLLIWATEGRTANLSW